MSATNDVHQSHIVGGNSLLEDDSLGAALPKALAVKLEDWLALELTAERMAQAELTMVGDFVAGDVRLFIEDIQTGWRDLEMKALDYLLSLADPTQKEWLQHHWLEKSADNISSDK